jgi:uncharacterized membrane protein
MNVGMLNRRTRFLERLPAGLTALAILGRLVPHPPNFAPVGAAGLYAGSRMTGWQRWLVPLLAMVITDPLLALWHGFSPFTPITLVVYGSLCVYVWLGKRFLSRLNPRRLIVTSLAGSFQFYVLTNLAVWAFAGTYPATWSGLAACYLAAIPFFGWTVAGDLVYSGALFGIEAWARRCLKAGLQPA